MLSHTAIRKSLGKALTPIRHALHSTESGSHMPVEIYGYKFTGCRLYKAPGQIGYVWKANYTGIPVSNTDGWSASVSGTIEECATQLYFRQNSVQPDWVKW